MNELSLKYFHCTDKQFFEAFRKDLSSSEKNILILSPFLSSNRAISYYPVFQSLIIKSVKIEVYVKPKSEQPGFLFDHFLEVQRRLKQIGIKFFVRPGMHEKIGIIDGKIIWHGSLNILSHNNTKESMLRFDSSELVQDVLLSLNLDEQKSDADLDLDSEKQAKKYRNNQKLECPLCKGLMHFYENSKMWICSNSPDCTGTLMDDASGFDVEPAKSSSLEKVNLYCPMCNKPLIIKHGLFTNIVCSSDSCDFSLDQRLSAGISRILRKKNSK